MLGYYTILDYCIYVYVLGMSEYNYNNLLQVKHGKYEDTMTGQYMESRKQVNINLIGIDNKPHAIDIVDVHVYLFNDNIISIH